MMFRLICWDTQVKFSVDGAMSRSAWYKVIQADACWIKGLWLQVWAAKGWDAAVIG